METSKKTHPSALTHLLQGSWAFERKVSDPNLTLVGQAIIHPIQRNILLYEESGLYHLHGMYHSFYQRRKIVFQGRQLLILKMNDEVLHDFIWDKGAHLPLSLKHVHHCGQDVYKTEIIFQTVTCFSQAYRVRGPRKAYTIHTRYRKIT
ncbi:MAG: DUF6314 family protein [Holosporales bacterium]